MSTNPITRHVSTRCPQCSHELDASTEVTPDAIKPEAGDPCVCLNCGQILTYQPDLSLRKATVYEIRDLMTEPAAWTVIEKVQLYIRARGRFE